MGFKSLRDYTKDKYKNLFVLPNDGDTADVIFLYTCEEDVLMPDNGTHYLKSAEYSGYVHCNGSNCEICKTTKIRKQTRLFIPLYNITDGEVQIWDRSDKFREQLYSNVLRSYPNPSEYVFRVTRNGGAGDMDTRYDLTVIGRNTSMTRDQILQNAGLTFESAYELAIKEFSNEDLRRMLANNNAQGSSQPYEFTPTPRSTVSYEVPEGLPETDVPEVAVPELVAPPEDLVIPEVDPSTQELEDVHF